MELLRKENDDHEDAQQFSLQEEKYDDNEKDAADSDFCIENKESNADVRDIEGDYGEGQPLMTEISMKNILPDGAMPVENGFANSHLARKNDNISGMSSDLVSSITSLDSNFKASYTVSCPTLQSIKSIMPGRHHCCWC